MDSIPCEVCGCTEYSQRSGFYICNNCDTQSQNIENQYFEEGYQRGPDPGEKEEVTSQRSFAERNLTSWECYNVILGVLVDELIQLGASRQLKMVAFQLWASYLQWSKVAFISKTEEKIPALNLGFRSSDVETLYGTPNLKRKILKTRYVSSKRSRTSKMSDSESVSTVSTRSVKMKQRKKAMNETMNLSDYEKSDIDTLESLDKERESIKISKQNIVFKSTAKSLIKEIVGPDRRPKNPEELKRHLEERRLNVGALVYKRKRLEDSQRGVNAVTNNITLVAILSIALQVLNDEISLNDILRWICEGRLSINQPEKFVPSFSEVIIKRDVRTQRKAFLSEMRNITQNLKMPDVPTPNLFKLAERYCAELCLPDDFLKLVLKLMVASNVEMNYEKYNFAYYPDYDCRVMALILFVFKLLFSLNDVTEFQQSAFADAVNESRQSQPEDEIPKLFSWNSWIKFMECRKAVLSRYNEPISEMADYQKYCEEDVYLNRWEKVQPAFSAHEPCLNKALESSMSQEIRSVLSENTQHTDVGEFAECPASLTPWNTLTEHILKNHSSSLSTRTKKILSESFKTQSIKHVMDSKWCSDVAESLKMKVELCSPHDQLDMEIFEEVDIPFARISMEGRKMMDRPVPVVIRNTGPPSERSFRKDKLYSHLYDCEDIIYEEGQSSSQCEQNDFKIGGAPRYWCLLPQSTLNLAEFETLARTKFPRSFLWLLRECAAMLQCDASELHSELIYVERVLHRLYSNSQVKRTNNVKMDKW